MTSRGGVRPEYEAQIFDIPAIVRLGKVLGGATLPPDTGEPIVFQYRRESREESSFAVFDKN